MFLSLLRVGYLVDVDVDVARSLWLSPTFTEIAKSVISR